MNRSAQANNSTGLKGVFPHRKGWSAQIKVGDTRHHLGTYDTPEAAHAAYCAASERLHGAFGRTE